MNALLEEYRYNIIAAATRQTKVLSRDKWAYAFLVMAREVARLQAVIDGGEPQFTFEEMRRDANNRWQVTGEWPGYGPDAVSERTGE